jgi:hypothetical protein
LATIRLKIYIRRFVYMPSHLNVPTKYWELTKEVPPPPIERDINTWIIANPSDPLWDIDVIPLTYTDSRWSAFVISVDEASRQRLVPNPPLTVWDGEDADLVEYWYVEHINTMLGPYLEFGVTISATYKDPKGNVWNAGYYPYMYLTGDAPVDAGRVLGFPKKMSYIRITTHGGEKGTDFFGYAMSRNGYLLHSATGQFDDKPVKPPYFYGKTDWGKFNMKVVTRPDLSSSEWQLTYIASELPEAFNIKGHRFQIKPEHTRTASGDAINWFQQATPFDNMGAEVKVQEVTGLISFVFDLVIPVPSVLWTETYERPASYRGYATPYKYGLRQQFPISQGS